MLLMPNRWPPAWAWTAAVLLTIAALLATALGAGPWAIGLLAVLVLVAGARGTSDYHRALWDDGSRDDE